MNTWDSHHLQPYRDPFIYRLIPVTHPSPILSLSYSAQYLRSILITTSFHSPVMPTSSNSLGKPTLAKPTFRSSQGCMHRDEYGWKNPQDQAGWSHMKFMTINPKQAHQAAQHSLCTLLITYSHTVSHDYFTPSLAHPHSQLWVLLPATGWVVSSPHSQKAMFEVITSGTCGYYLIWK